MKLSNQINKNLKSVNTRLILAVKCSNLSKVCGKDSINPLLIVSVQKLNNQVLQIFRSQPLFDTFNPIFNEPIHIDYQVRDILFVFFDVYHNDKKLIFVGRSKATLSELITAKNGMLRMDVTKMVGLKLKSGSIMEINSEVCEKQFTKIRLKLKGEIKNKISWFPFKKKSSHFIRLYEASSSKQNIMLYESEKREQKNICAWEQMQFFLDHCEGSKERNIRIQLINDTGNKHEIIGLKQIKLSDLQQCDQFEINGLNNKAIGSVAIQNYHQWKLKSLESYITAGMKIKMMFGVDFSASNKHYANVKSNHYIYKGINAYERTINNLYNALIGYSDSPNVPFYAIATKVNHPKLYTGSVVQDCFPFNGSISQPSIENLENFNSTYHKLLPMLQFSGPFRLEKILLKLKEYSEVQRKMCGFTLLVILNDGSMKDIEISKRIMGQLCYYPVFILMIGIGSEQFKEIKQLMEVKYEMITADDQKFMRTIGCFVREDDDSGLSQGLKQFECSVIEFMKIMTRSNPEEEQKVFKQQKSNLTACSLQNSVGK